MSGLTVALFLAAAVGFWRQGNTLHRWRAAPGRTAGVQPQAEQLRKRRFGRSRSRETPDHGESYALLIRELAGLLTAGRSGQRIWADAAALYHPGRPGIPDSPFAPVLQAAAAAAALGISPVPVFAAAAGGSGGRPGISGRRPPVGQSADRDLWAGLAVCVRVSERSGAPLSAVLARYAGQLDDARDARADREAALAGPRATVRLLTWLPAGGMALGYLLGGNPLQVLTGTPAGWSAAAAGCAFWLAGRIWSGRLVRNAASPPESP